MEDNLIGKYYHVYNEDINDALVYVESTLDLGLYYICKMLVKSTKGIGYFSDTDVLHFGCNDFIEVNPMIWSKIHKILEMNTIACNTIIQNCEKYEFFTGYYVSIFTTRTHYKLFEVLENSQILTRFGNNQVWIKELKDNAIKFETMFSTNRKWISPETYHRVKDNVTNTIEQIDEIWISI